MAKITYKSGWEKAAIVIFFILVSLSLLSPLWVFKDLLFPFITSKAFFFRVCLELAFPFYVFLVIVRKEYRPDWKNPLVLSMLAFLAISFVSSFTGVNVTRSLWGNFERMGGAYYLLHLVLLAMYVLLLSRIGGKYVEWILYVAFGVASFITLNGLSGWVGGPTVVTDPSLPARVSSTLGNPIFLGSYLIIPMFLAAFFALQAESLWKKLVFWALVLLQLVGIFLSVTRGAIVGLAAGLVFGAAVYVIAHASHKVRIYGGTLIAIGIVLVAGLFIYHKKLPDNRLTRLFNLEDSNSQARLLQWRSALTGFKDSPVLGVGPENYYIISNKYYDPKIVQYDPSWFDKPHNYILEVLVTTGALGFIAYAAVLLLVLWALWRAYRAGFLSLMQLGLLSAGFASYLVQNLFVFDTIPASLMFYVFVGFAVYLWDVVAQVNSKETANKQVPNARPAGIGAGSEGLALAAAGVVGVVALYAAYVTNIIPGYAASDVNYGYAYASVDPAKAVGYFEDAANSTFNFDPQDTAQRFSEATINIVQSGQLDQKTMAQDIDKATAYEQQTAEAIGNDPISWQKLATDYYIQSVVEKIGLNAGTETAVQKAIALAPKRYEPSLFQAQLYIAENNLQSAATILQGMTSTFPTVSYTASSWWLLANTYHSLNNDDQGLQIVNKMIGLNFKSQSTQDLVWVTNYYEGKKDYANELKVLQTEAIWFPGDSNVFFGLAQAYAKNGQNDLAKEIATQLLQATTTSDSNKAIIQQFLSSLK